MIPIISMHMWASLSAEQRNRIRTLFSIPRSSFVIVNDGRIETDGTTPEDFQALTIEKMQVYLKNDLTDFHKLFDLVIARVQDDIEGRTYIENPVLSTEPLTVVIPPKKRGRKTKIN